ncbi:MULTISPECIES: hypothetical protein [Peribacillus]|uniref:hypothetical protein n=1 Tax=Peribacillus TaxID=2675229 RepID=UPI001F4EE2A2|nr:MULTISPECIES: hypothetical protein [unclassified Peribacillus]MCK1985187.1 hypothetical protein [Peribacillus sp. Aquil_B1]MCK2007163.1 hypothetical protein [Peribacillus sp. Aquil_B8]
MKVYVIATGDPCWENEVTDYPVFGDSWIVEIQEGFLTFKKLTDKRVNGLPVLDIGVCPRFEIVWDKGVPDLEWLRRATLLEVMEKFAR